MSDVAERALGGNDHEWRSSPLSIPSSQSHLNLQQLAPVTSNQRDSHTSTAQHTPAKCSIFLLQQRAMPTFTAPARFAGLSLYAVLGVDTTATTTDIKRGYRRAALKYHPDHNHSPNATDEFTYLAHAHEDPLTPQHARYVRPHGRARRVRRRGSGGSGGGGGRCIIGRLLAQRLPHHHPARHHRLPHPLHRQAPKRPPTPRPRTASTKATCRRCWTRCRSPMPTACRACARCSTRDCHAGITAAQQRRLQRRAERWQRAEAGGVRAAGGRVAVRRRREAAGGGGRYGGSWWRCWARRKEEAAAKQEQWLGVHGETSTAAVRDRARDNGRRAKAIESGAKGARRAASARGSEGSRSVARAAASEEKEGRLRRWRRRRLEAGHGSMTSRARRSFSAFRRRC